MINDFEDADEAQSHAKTQETSGVSNEGDDGNVLILLHTLVRVLTLILMLILPKSKTILQLGTIFLKHNNGPAYYTCTVKFGFKEELETKVFYIS